jgi:predicted transcriptional regulator
MSSRIAKHVSNGSEVNAGQKVTVAARVPPALADAVRALADAGDRTVSREVASAIREHVDRAPSSQASAVAAFTSSATRSTASAERGEVRTSRLADIRRSSPGAPDVPGPPTGAEAA